MNDDVSNIATIYEANAVYNINQLSIGNNGLHDYVFAFKGQKIEQVLANIGVIRTSPQAKGKKQLIDFLDCLAQWLKFKAGDATLPLNDDQLSPDDSQQWKTLRDRWQQLQQII